jgi:hypothetical protein
MRVPRISGAVCAVAGISLMYWICAATRAAYRPFWFDEIVTWHVARLPSVAAIWAVLHQGVDQETPFTHLAVRLSHSLFGSGYLATRLPALTGFWIMLLGVYAFLKRRLPTEYALIGMAFPMLTFAWSYAFEARAYGVVLGCGAVALVAWQNAAEGRWRRLSLVAISMSLALALGSHLFSVLLAIPLVFGEGFRTLERKRVDWAMWGAFAAGALGLLTYPDSLQVTRDWDMTGLQPSFLQFPELYDTLFRNAIAPLLIAGLAVCVLTRREKDKSVGGPILPRRETAALLGFVIAPAVFFVGRYVSNRFVYNPRYGMVCVIGASCGIAVVLFRAAGGGRRAGAIILGVMVAWLGLARGREAFSNREDPRLQFEEDNPVLVAAMAKNTPVVVVDPLSFLAADFYMPADTLERLSYITADREIARQYEWQDIVDQLVTRETRSLPVRAHVEPLRDYVARHPRFMLHTMGGSHCLFDVLMRGGWRLTLSDQRGREFLYEVTAPGEAVGGDAGVPR